ncbi:MAG: cell wall hydrolase [Alphaproteobacteria bacterium]|nr:cell wall hydrolase [Alphaproteobacteria bacterium]
MQFIVIENHDDTQKVSYKIARIVYAETLAKSLSAVEALSAMIYNIHTKYNKSFEDIADDKDLFDSLSEKSWRHKYLSIPADDRKFQMCLRVVKNMIRGFLNDNVYGATKFHHVDIMPDWAVARGYIAEYEDMLFYL